MIRAALAEAAWLRSDRREVLAQVAAARATSWAEQLGRPSGELALWAWRFPELRKVDALSDARSTKDSRERRVSAE